MNIKQNYSTHPAIKPLTSFTWLMGFLLLASPINAEVTLVAPGVISTGLGEHSPTLDVKRNELVFMRRTPGRFDYTLYSSSYTKGQWSQPTVLPFSGTHRDGAPSFSADGQTLLFDSRRPHPDLAPGSINLWQVNRTASSWGTPEPLLTLSQNQTNEKPAGLDEFGPLITPAGDIWFYAFRQPHRAGSHYRSQPGQAPQAMRQLPDPSADTFVGYLTLSNDGRTAVIEGRSRSGRDGDLFYACLKGDQWTTAEPLVAVNTSANDGNPYLTADMQWLWFASDRGEPSQGQSNLFRIHTKDLPIPCE